MSALKRCASSGTSLGRPNDQRYNVMLQQQQALNAQNGIVQVRDVRPGPGAESLLEFLAGDNKSCAECGSPTVSWVSLSLGMLIAD